MTMNLRIDNRFVEDENWDTAAEAYTRFLRLHSSAPLVLLEIGVGYHTPQIIKYAFWQMTDENPKATYVLVNPKDILFPKEIEQRTIAVKENADSALSQILHCAQEDTSVDETN